MKKALIPVVAGISILLATPVAATQYANNALSNKISSSESFTPSYNGMKLFSGFMDWINKSIPQSTRGEKKVDPIFTSVSETALSKDQQAFVKQFKNKKGVYNMGDLYVISRGPCPNPGYGLQIVGEKSTWEEAMVYVRLTNPQPNKMYTQVITTPYLVGKVKVPPYTSVSFINIDTEKTLFE